MVLRTIRVAKEQSAHAAADRAMVRVCWPHGYAVPLRPLSLSCLSSASVVGSGSGISSPASSTRARQSELSKVARRRAQGGRRRGQGSGSSRACWPPGRRPWRRQRQQWWPGWPRVAAAATGTAQGVTPSSGTPLLRLGRHPFVWDATLFVWDAQ